MRYVCVGEDIIFPVVSPSGKQRRRKAPTMHHRAFCGAIRRYNVETWYILQHRYITGPIRFCPETCHVGGRILSAPTQTVPLNYCRGYFVAFVGAVLRTLPTGCDAVRLRRGRYYLPGCFPIGETTSAQSADKAPSNICSAIRRHYVTTWCVRLKINWSNSGSICPGGSCGRR